MVNVSADRSYQDILRDQLNLRLRANPRYSLRAFARDLGISPSRLSEVLNRKQGLSKVSARKLAGRMGFTPEETSVFCDLVESVDARNKLSQQVAQVRLQKHLADQSYQTLQLDAFQTVADWYHFAILQLLRLDGFESDPAWIARRLEISPSEAIAALARLTRLEMIELDRKGRYRAAKDYVASPDGVPSEAIKKFHQQILEKAAASLYTQSVEERDFSASLMAVDSRDVAAIRKSIRGFRRRTARAASAKPRRDEIYCLSVQFFRLSDKKPSPEKSS